MQGGGLMDRTGECRCGGYFLDAEDYRDHLPCPGDASEERERGKWVKILREWAAWGDANDAKSKELGIDPCPQRYAALRDVADVIEDNNVTPFKDE
jgi:hypothetical protein